MKKALRVLISVLFALGGLYVGLYLMFIGGIIQIVEAVKLDPVSSSGIALGVAKLLFAGFVGCLIFYVGILINFALGLGKRRKNRR